MPELITANFRYRRLHQNLHNQVQSVMNREGSISQWTSVYQLYRNDKARFWLTLTDFIYFAYGSLTAPKVTIETLDFIRFEIYLISLQVWVESGRAEEFVRIYEQAIRAWRKQFPE